MTQPKAWRLRSGQSLLTLTATTPGRIGLRLQLAAKSGPPSAFVQDTPLMVEVVDDRGQAQWLAGGYTQVTAARATLSCVGRLQSPNGTQFRVTDTYRSLPTTGAFTLMRRVDILQAGAADRGFSSRFSLAPARPSIITDCDFFAPGIWYKDNRHVPPKALASHLKDRCFLFREDRLPLPLIMQRDKRDGATLTLAHLDGHPTTFAGEDGLARVIDARMQFGSVGIVNVAGPSPTFQFPGTEGERTYIYGGSLQGNRWAYRSHPVQVGFSHSYHLLLQIGRTPDFPAAVRRAWRTVYDQQPPPIVIANLAKVYRDGIALLGTYSRTYEGVPSVPFAATVPDGTVVDTSSQMGFVGQALPAAWLLLQDGLANHDADAVARATALVDLWARKSPTPSGLPRTWYDIQPGGRLVWRNYHTFLRVASDGVDGALQAWATMRRHGQDRPEWLAFCRRYGDWLVQAQAADGSWAREYDFEGRAVNSATDTTDQAISFLVDLYKATDDARYKQAALRAGDFCRRSVHEAYAYVGGTPDNPNVLDKEGGMMALAAFLALHDIGGDRHWLEAASQAAWYSETWVYGWNIPMPSDDPKIVFPKRRTTVGLSLIATGHSGADTYMAAAPFLFYRLFLLTGETHFRDVARMLLHDTKQMLDWDGSLGYKYPGLQTEALSLPPLRGHGVTHWLPWLTVAQLEPLVRLRDVFGSWDIDEIERRPPPERRERDAQFSARRGFPVPSTP